MDSTEDTHPNVPQKNHEAESKLNIACSMTNEEESTNITPSQQDNPQQKEEEEAESKFNIACSMTNEEESTNITPSQQDNPQQKEEEESPSCLVLQEDEENQVFQKQTYLQNIAWNLFQDYEKKLHTMRSTGDIHRKTLKESFHYLHQYLILEEETQATKQENSLEKSVKDLEARAQSLLGLSTTITNFLLKLEKAEMTTETLEHLKKIRDRLEELSTFSVALKSNTSPFQVQEWRGIRHIVKPMVASIRLDPNSANPYLFVSKNLKQVRYTSYPQPRVTNTFFEPGLYVLGQPGFQSGQHYWEVDVGHKSNWILGVVEHTVSRKGTQNLSVNNGFWVVRKQEDNMYYGCDLSTLKLMASPLRIGVFVDFFSGEIAFYNADTTELMFELSGCLFVRTLFPFFCPGVPVKEEDLGPLSIS